MTFFGLGSPPAGGGGGEFGEPAWEWNGTDISQFAGSASFSLGTVTPTLEVVANANGNQVSGNELRLSSTGTGQASVGYFIQDELPFVGEARDMVIEYVMGSATTSYFGFSILADDSGTAHCYNALPGVTAGWRSQVDAGVVTVPGTTPPRVITGADAERGRIYVRAIKPSGAAPRLNFIHEGLPGAVGTTHRQDVRSDFPNDPPAASWNALECKKVGLMVQASGGGALGDVRLTEMRVFVL